jgi:protocadherin Fat 1/2/3
MIYLWNVWRITKELLYISGVISIAEQLDYERAKDYFLTIQAVDGGTPPLSNHATVNISVTDSNDNAPIFNQASYSARIREDAQIGDKILQVKIHKNLFCCKWLL